MSETATGGIRVAGAGTVDPDRWFGGGRTAPGPAARVRLFCFAHAGGGSAFFRPWRLALAPRIEVCPVILPGREARVHELPYRRIEQVLDPLCRALDPHLDRPYAFFGHSLGAILAYEVARRCSVGSGSGPLALVVSGRRAPRLPSRRPFLSALPDPEFLEAVGALGGTPPEVLGEPRLIQMVLPALRSDFELNEAYRPLPGPRLRCPVAAYLGADDPEVDRGELLGWHEETSGDFTLRVFSGGHFYLKGGRADVCTAVCQDLDRVLG